MRTSIEDNLRHIRDYYDSLFDLVGRNRAYDSATFEQRPPIVNMGYWLGGATTAREAQEQLVRELAERTPELQGKHVLDVGCRLAGPATLLACVYGAEVDGVNIVERQVEWARRYIHANGIADK